ncbi:NAD(P)-binding protein [Comamonas testosteroni]|nr:NAD(P)-binding protein [Comamonas testosteroni]
MKIESTASKVAIVGAGNSGVVCAKVLGQQGLDVAVFEKGSQLGGLWSFGNDNGMSSICRSLNINTSTSTSTSTSNRMMQLPDCPMSDCVAVLQASGGQCDMALHIRV